VPLHEQRSFSRVKMFIFALTYMMPLCGISNSPEKQGVSAIARTAQFFPCEDALSSHYYFFRF
jgi:hypothetical protein